MATDAMAQHSSDTDSSSDTPATPQVQWDSTGTSVVVYGPGWQYGPATCSYTDPAARARLAACVQHKHPDASSDLLAQLAGGSGWNAAAPVGHIAGPTLDLKGWPPVLRRQIESVAAHSQVSPDAAAVMALAATSYCLTGRVVQVTKAGNVLPPQIYALLVAPPGYRKSSLMQPMLAPIKHLQAQRLAQHLDDLAGYADRLATLQAQPKAKRDQAAIDEIDELQRLCKRKAPTLYCNTGSAAGIESALLINQQAGHGYLLLADDEGGLLDSLLGAKGGAAADLSAVLKGYSGEHLSKQYRGDGLSVDLHINLASMLAIQPSRLHTYGTAAELQGTGYWERQLYCLPRVNHQLYGAEQPLDPQAAADYSDLLVDLYGLPRPVGADGRPQPGCIAMAADAELIYEAYCNRHTQVAPDAHTTLRGWVVGRLPGHLRRVALVLHAAHHGAGLADLPPIDAGTMVVATQVLDWARAHAAAAVDVMQGTGQQTADDSRLWDTIGPKLRRDTTKGDSVQTDGQLWRCVCRQSYWVQAGKRRYYEALERLVAAGKLLDVTPRVAPDGPGRRTTYYQLPG